MTSEIYGTEHLIKKLAYNQHNFIPCFSTAPNPEPMERQTLETETAISKTIQNLQNRDKLRVCHATLAGVVLGWARVIASTIWGGYSRGTVKVPVGNAEKQTYKEYRDNLDVTIVKYSMYMYVCLKFKESGNVYVQYIRRLSIISIQNLAFIMYI